MTDDISERLRRAFDADSVAEKNLAIRAAFDFIAAMQPAPQEPVDSAAEITRLTEALRAAEEREKGLREAEVKAARLLEQLRDFDGWTGTFHAGHAYDARQEAISYLNSRQALAGAKP